MKCDFNRQKDDVIIDFNLVFDEKTSKINSYTVIV